MYLFWIRFFYLVLVCEVVSSWCSGAYSIGYSFLFVYEVVARSCSPPLDVCQVFLDLVCV